MPDLKTTVRGQITLRKEVLRHLGIKPGEKIAVDKLPGGRVSLRAARPAGSIRDVFGILAGKSKRKLTIEEINEVAADGWAGLRRK
jgi:antitoxin PrlF